MAQNTPQPEVQLVEMGIHEAADWQESQVKLLEDRLKEKKQELNDLVLELKHARTKMKAMKSAKENTRQETIFSPPPKARGKTTPIDPSIKALVVEKVGSGEMTWEEAQKAYNISSSSIGRILTEARKRKVREEREAAGLPVEEPAPKKKRGPKIKLSGEDLLEILDWVEEDNGLTLKEIVLRLKEQRGITISKATLHNYFKKMDISYKDVLPIPQRWNTLPVIDQRQQYVIKFLQLTTHTKIFLDECPFNLLVRRRKGRALRGEPATLSVLPKGRNLSFLAAISPSGILYHKFVPSTGPKKRGVNADDFIVFLNALSTHLSANFLVILDNAKIHHAEQVEAFLDTLKKAKGIETLFLPPYSPFLNPIEYAFAKIKKKVRKAIFTNQAELQSAIEEAINDITAKDIEGWYAHTQAFFIQCLFGLPFSGKPLAPPMGHDPSPSTQIPAALLPPPLSRLPLSPPSE
jgi:transposase